MTETLPLILKTTKISLRLKTSLNQKSEIFRNDNKIPIKLKVATCNQLPKTPIMLKAILTNRNQTHMDRCNQIPVSLENSNQTPLILCVTPETPETLENPKPKNQSFKSFRSLLSERALNENVGHAFEITEHHYANFTLLSCSKIKSNLSVSIGKYKNLLDFKERMTKKLKRITVHSLASIMQYTDYDGYFANIRLKKEKIPKNVRKNVWNHWIGAEKGLTNCPVCNLVELDKGGDYHCGHVISELCGGSLEIDNLRPICSGCNSSMGAMNMFTYAKTYYPHTSVLTMSSKNQAIKQ